MEVQVAEEDPDRPVQQVMREPADQTISSIALEGQETAREAALEGMGPPGEEEAMEAMLECFRSMS